MPQNVDDPAPTPKRKRGRWIAGVAALFLAFLGTMVAAEAVRFAGDEIEQHEDLAAFYAQPAGAADGAPGTLVRHEALIGTPVDTRAWRIMYRTTDLGGNPVVATGIVITPLGPAPEKGRTVLAWGHPTTGTALDCAPSRSTDPFLGIEGLRFMLDRGYTVVATDYVGMGTDGPDSYLIGKTAAHAVLDSVRAAQALPDTQAGSDVVLWGHSQGGQAVLFSAEQAPTYAPELTILAVAAAAPAADLPSLLGDHLKDISGVTIGSYAFQAFADVYGRTHPGAQVDDILTPAAVAALPELNSLCLLTHLDQLHAIGTPLIGNFIMADPITTAPWPDLLAENSAGSVAFKAPLFIAQGLSDQLVVPSSTEAFVAHEKGQGMDVTFLEMPGATHGTIAYEALPSFTAWLDKIGH